MHHRLALKLVVFVLPLLLSAGARAGGDDAMDLAFWQSIQNSTDPAEYQTYLDAFPNGKFAKLAFIRAHPTAPAATLAIPLPSAGTMGAGTTGEPGPVAQPEGDDGDSPAGKILLEPAAARVGQTIRVTCEDFPEPATADELVVVPAGTPVMDPSRPVDQTKVIWFVYALNCFHVPVTAGPFAPGAYEIRFMTRLYNNTGLSELHAMTRFRVR